jgi:DNA-binding transcriptional LysR family regulator
MFARRSSPGPHDLITATCRNAGFSLNVVHEIDNMSAGLTMVTAGLGMSFCSPSIRKFWPRVAFRPFYEDMPLLECAIGYRRGAQQPALESFLGVVRKISGAR